MCREIGIIKAQSFSNIKFLVKVEIILIPEMTIGMPTLDTDRAIGMMIVIMATIGMRIVMIRITASSRVTREIHTRTGDIMIIEIMDMIAAITMDTAIEITEVIATMVTDIIEVCCLYYYYF